MWLSIVVALRECLEMLLIIVPLLVYIYKIKRYDLSKFIFLGIGTGILLSIVSAVFLFTQIYKMEGYSQQLFLGISMIFLAALILYSIVWVSKQNKNFSLDITDKYDIKLQGFSLFILSLITIFRESLEIIMFLVPISTSSPLKLTLGVVIGAACAIILAYFIFKVSVKINIYVIFTILTLILIIIGGRLLGEGFSIILPNVKSIDILGNLIYTVPLLFIFLKRELRKYLKKS